MDKIDVIIEKLDTIIALLNSAEPKTTVGQKQRQQRNDDLYKDYIDSGLSVVDFCEKRNKGVTDPKKQIKKSQMYNIINQRNAN